MEQSFIAYIENSIKENWDLDALTDYNGATLQYKDVARKIEKVHLIFEASGIKKGDKIAICGRNSSHWGATFLHLPTEQLQFLSFMSSKRTMYTTLSITPKQNYSLWATRYGKTSTNLQ